MSVATVTEKLVEVTVKIILGTWLFWYYRNWLVVPFGLPHFTWYNAFGLLLLIDIMFSDTSKFE